jgi:hypothetical protein
MRKIIKIILFFFTFFLVLPISVQAQPVDICAEGMIESIKIEAKTEQDKTYYYEIHESSIKGKVYNTGSIYYADEALTDRITDIREIEINYKNDFIDSVAADDGGLGEATKIRFNIPPNLFDRTKQIEDIRNDNYTQVFSFKPTGDDVALIFGSEIVLELREAQGGSNVVCSRGYSFATEGSSRIGDCRLSMQGLPKGATVDDDILIHGENIDDEGEGLRIFLNGSDISPLSWKVHKDGSGVYLTKNASGYFTMDFPLGKKSVGNYTFDVRYEDGDKEGQVICSFSFPVVPFGAEPTPGELATRSAESILSLEVTSTMPLCETLIEPGYATVGDDCTEGGDCLSRYEKCMECQTTDSIWTGLGCIPTNLSGIVKSIFSVFSGIIGGIIFLCIVGNGVKIMMAAGNQETIKKAQEALTACIVGFLVLTFSILFLKIVGVDILRLPGWGST